MISKYYLFGFLTIILGAILRFFMLTDKSLWLDEGASLDYSTAANALEVISRLIAEDSGDRFQPLYYLILFYWRQLFGDSEFVVRSLSAFLGIGAVILIFFTTEQIYGKKSAFWSTLIMAFSCFSIYYSQQTRPYALLLFVASLQLYLFTKALNETEERKTIYPYLFAFTTAFGLLCSILIGIFTLALSLSYILIYKNFKRWLSWWIPTIFFCVPVFWFYLISPHVTSPTKVLVTTARQPIVQNILFVIYGLLVGETYGPPIDNLRGEKKISVLFNYLPHLLILTIVALTIFVFLLKSISQTTELKRYRKADLFLVTVLIISFIITVIFAIVTKLNLLPRHSFYIYLPLIILIPSIIRTDKKSLRAYIALVALVVLNIYSVSNYYFNQNYQRENYEIVAQHIIKSRNSPSVKSVLIYGAPNLLPYYGDNFTLNGLNLDTNNLAEQVKALTNDAETVIIAISYQSYWEWKHNISLEKAMSKLYTLKSQKSFTNFNVYRYVKSN